LLLSGSTFSQFSPILGLLYLIAFLGSGLQHGLSLGQMGQFLPPSCDFCTDIYRLWQGWRISGFTQRQQLVYLCFEGGT
jgi:hypothetical protein